MQIQVFKIPVESNSSMMEEMNKFLRGNKIVDVAQEFLSDNTGANLANGQRPSQWLINTTSSCKTHI